MMLTGFSRWGGDQTEAGQQRESKDKSFHGEFDIEFSHAAIASPLICPTGEAWRYSCPNEEFFTTHQKHSVI